MVKIEEIIDKYKGYEVDEKELEKILVEPKHKPNNIWELEVNDDYWYLGNEGTIYHEFWSGNTIAKRRRAYGNVFLTEEEAEFEVKRREVETILLKYGSRNPPLKKFDEKKYIIIAEPKLSVAIGSYFDISPYPSNVNHTTIMPTIYFDTEELCMKAIEEAGVENVGKYLFGI